MSRFADIALRFVIVAFFLIMIGIMSYKFATPVDPVVIPYPNDLPLIEPLLDAHLAKMGQAIKNETVRLGDRVVITGDMAPPKGDVLDKGRYISYRLDILLYLQSIRSKDGKPTGEPPGRPAPAKPIGETMTMTLSDI